MSGRSDRDPVFLAPTRIAFTEYDKDDERRRESLLGLGNGVLFVRACPPEAAAEDAHHYPGTYRAGLYNRRDEQVDGERLGHDSLVNLPNWLALIFRLGPDEAWFSLRDGEILDYRHELDVARAVAERRALVRDARGRRVRIREQRLVSMAQPMLAALRLEITPEDWSGTIEIRSAIEGGVANHNTDARALTPYRHLEEIGVGETADGMLLLCARTNQSQIAITLAARTRADARRRRVSRESDAIAEHLECETRAGSACVVEKIAAIASARDPATSAATEAARQQAAEAGDFAALLEPHVRAWEMLWARIGIAAENPVVARGCAFHAFHLLQTVSPHSPQIDVGLPARGWQEAYHGQIFWDELFAFPFLNHRFPEIARGLLLYRYRRLPEARRNARRAGRAGALFPWRSALTGAEETPSFQFNPLSRHWMPDHTRLQRHIGAAIAHNAIGYCDATGDESFLVEYGAEMIVEIARFWASAVEHDPGADRYDIRGIIGPDEYHNAYPGAAAPGLDNNAYTNVMAAAALMRAGDVLDRLPARRRDALAGGLGLSAAEIASWRRIASRLRLCFHDGAISQFEGFDTLRPFDGRGFAERHPDGRLDWELEARGDTIDAYRVSKQPDTLMLLHLFTPAELIALIGRMGYVIDEACLRRTVARCLEQMTHESSLSRVVCAGALAKLDGALSWQFFESALCIDFRAENDASAAEGLHLGAMAGTLDVMQRHYLGLGATREGLVLDPAPPPALGPVHLALQQRGGLFALDWDGHALTLAADAGNREALRVRVRGSWRSVQPGAEVTLQPSG